MAIIKESDFAERIKQAYESYNFQGSKATFVLPSREELEKIAEQGDLEARVYPYFCANALFEMGNMGLSDALITRYSIQQMKSLAKKKRTQVNVHLAELLKEPSTGIYNQTLTQIEPFSHIETDSVTFPFLSIDKDGICGIESIDQKALYVNPQLFYRPVSEPLLKTPFDPTNNQFVEAYRFALSRSFGQKTIDCLKPWLKQ